MEATQRGTAEATVPQTGVTPRLDDAQERLEELNQRVTTFIRERPGTCLLAAVALGFVIGRLASR